MEFIKAEHSSKDYMIRALARAYKHIDNLDDLKPYELKANNIINSHDITDEEKHFLKLNIFYLSCDYLATKNIKRDLIAWKMWNELENGALNILIDYKKQVKRFI